MGRKQKTKSVFAVHYVLPNARVTTAFKKEVEAHTPDEARDGLFILIGGKALINKVKYLRPAPVPEPKAQEAQQ